MSVKSPCTDACNFSNSKGWCHGCGRTLQEAREWRKLTPFHRQKIQRALASRLKIITLMIEEK